MPIHPEAGAVAREWHDKYRHTKFEGARNMLHPEAERVAKDNRIRELEAEIAALTRQIKDAYRTAEVAGEYVVEVQDKYNALVDAKTSVTERANALDAEIAEYREALTEIAEVFDYDHWPNMGAALDAVLAKYPKP